MVARSASQAGGFTPVEPPRIAVATDGTLATITESSRITILEIPGGGAFAEIGVDPEAAASEVAWLGTPPRLLVLSRYAAHSTAHLLDPHGPRTIAEIRLESPMRLYATVGGAALVVGALGAAVLVASETHLLPYQFPTRTVPVAAGAAGGQFVVALSGSIEEWDPQSRIPKRRLRLPRAAAITAVGGSERVVWMTTQQEPARIDVIPLVNRGQPKGHDLPEPIGSIASHPRSDLVACIGAETGRLYIVDLDGRARLRTVDPDGIDRAAAVGLVVGRMVGVLAAQAGHAIALVPLDGRELDSEPAASRGRPSSEPAPDDDDGPDPGEASGTAPPAVPFDRPPSPLPWSPSAQGSIPPPAAPAASPPPGAAGKPAAPPTLFRYPPAAVAPPRSAALSSRPAATASERFSAWRDLVRHDQPRIDPAATAGRPGASPGRNDARQSWRDEVVAWTRTIMSGAIDHHVPAAPLIDAVVARFDLALALQPVVALLYGAHLCGERGIAPVDVARVLDRQWDEALGRGELAVRGVADYAGSRVALSPLVLRVLDELPPATGVVVGEPGPVALLGPCLVVAGDEPLAAIAERCLASVGGAILAAHGEPDRAALVFEARARGAAALLRAAIDAVPSESAIFVIDDAELADRLGLPRLG